MADVVPVWVVFEVVVSVPVPVPVAAPVPVPVPVAVEPDFLEDPSNELSDEPLEPDPDEEPEAVESMLSLGFFVAWATTDGFFSSGGWGRTGGFGIGVATGGGFDAPVAVVPVSVPVAVPVPVPVAVPVPVVPVAEVVTVEPEEPLPVEPLVVPLLAVLAVVPEPEPEPEPEPDPEVVPVLPETGWACPLVPVVLERFVVPDAVLSDTETLLPEPLPLPLLLVLLAVLLPDPLPSEDVPPEDETPLLLDGPVLDDLDGLCSLIGGAWFPGASLKLTPRRTNMPPEASGFCVVLERSRGTEDPVFDVVPVALVVPVAVVVAPVDPEPDDEPEPDVADFAGCPETPVLVVVPVTPVVSDAELDSDSSSESDPDSLELLSLPLTSSLSSSLEEGSAKPRDRRSLLLMKGLSTVYRWVR